MSSIDSAALNNFIGQAAFANGPGSSNGPRGSASSGSSNSWYEAMSRAWGQTLDGQAAKITELSDQISTGGDQPSNMVALTASALKFQFMSNNAATSQNSVGDALSTVAKKH